MDTRQKIEVMQGWLGGKTVRVRGKPAYANPPYLEWRPLTHSAEPQWDWEKNDYELVTEPIVHYCNVYPKRRVFFDTAHEAKSAAVEGVLRIAVRLTEDPDDQET